MAEDRLLTAGEAMEYLGVSRQRLTQLREKGAITAVRAGHFWLYSRASLEAQKQRAEPYRLKDSAGILAAVIPA